MKLLCYVAFFVLGNAQGQEVGLRIGAINGNWGAAFDGVFYVGDYRMHTNVGVFQGGVGADIMWDLIYKPLPLKNFSWYLGLGPSAYVGSPFGLGIAGEIGLEYRFAEYPIVVGADWRPTFWLIEDTQIKADSFGLNVRWDFGANPKKEE